MKLVFFLYVILLFAFVKADNKNSTVIDEPRCIEMNKQTANGRYYYSFIVPAKYSCEEIGFTVNLCSPIIPEIIEFTNIPKVAINGQFELTFIGDEDALSKTVTQTLLETVKGPTQYFIVPDDARYLTNHIKIKFKPESDICEKKENFEKMIIQAFGVEKIVEMDDDDISEELEQLCYNNEIVVPFNIVLGEEEMKKRLIDDLNLLKDGNSKIITKLISASHVSDKSDQDRDLCRGYLYLKSMNSCNKIRLEEVKDSSPLSKEVNSVLSIGDKAPQFIKDCIRMMKIKPDEKPDYSKAKTVEESDWFVRMEL